VTEPRASRQGEDYAVLFTPANIGKLKLKNRMLMPPMCTNLADPFDNSVTQEMVDYYATRASGGIALIVVEFAAVRKDGLALLPQLGIYSDRHIPGLARLSEAIKQHGCISCIQIHHAGRQTYPEITGSRPVAPSAIPMPGQTTIPRELETEEVRELVGCFVAAAKRAKVAGFDCVEIHGAHGYLVSQFLSPDTNRRNDAYGGDLLGRTRFAVEIVQGIKTECGKDFPVTFRINGDDFVGSGLKIDECVRICKILENAGVDAISVSAGRYEDLSHCLMPSYYKKGYLLHLAETVKRNVRVPVIAVGRINNPDLAVQVLRDGKADVVALGRALIADPEFPKKVQQGRLEEIRHCVACNTCIGARVFNNLPIRCAINVDVIRGLERRLTRTDSPKKVVVVGGGPGGMEAARVAALRGHSVTLYERDRKVGGMVRLAGVPAFKEELRWLINWYEHAIRKAGVTVRLETEVTVESVLKESPDVVIVASGANDLVPQIPGAEYGCLATDVLRGACEVGARVLIVGGGLVGCELALYLADQGKDVTVVEMQDMIAPDLNPISRLGLIAKLNEKGVRALPGTHVVEIGKSHVEVLDRAGVRTRIEGVDVVLACGFVPNDTLYQELASSGKVHNVYRIGDCVTPRTIMAAIHEGASVAREI